ncbi:hypothetical protein PVAP13_6NG197803 [Panicum virgatum]|uniref:Gamma-glutamylcyclotransferase family protein n=1 Tax=Panicum virgatum TaxID=38727 RepID=A0A8T0QXG0_PANVG|nr:hypothetical protein PVAP13_6NG197803 [Panicum virgatum]
MSDEPPPKRTLVFTFGTLKCGFSNHTLLQELASSGNASFVGAAVTAWQLPLVCGPYRLYAVTAPGLARLDELEGVSRAHYERLPIAVDIAEGGCARMDDGYPEYCNAVADGYVRRKERRQGQTFLEQIRIFVSSRS